MTEIAIILVILFAVFLLIGIVYLFIRDSPSNNLRWARKHHKIAEKFYSEGKLEKSDKHYELSKNFREKAHEQMREGDD